MTELAVVASETHEKAIAYFKVAEQYGYKFIMEVKKIRDERLYKELGFTSFDTYCESAWKTVRRSMDERIQIADSFGNQQDFESTYSHLGHSKSLMLARMEPEIRQQIESTVNVDETTVKQLSKLEKDLKQTESERVRLENESIYYQKLLNQERSKPSQVVTKEVQIMPSDYQDLKQQAANGQKLNTENVQLQRTIQQMKEESTKTDEVALAAKKLRESFKNLLSSVNQENYNAKFYFDQIAGTTQSFQIVQAFQQEFNEIINTVLLDWKDRTQLKAI